MSCFPTCYCVKEYENRSSLRRLHLWTAFCFRHHEIVWCYCRARKNFGSGEIIHANRERWLKKLSGRNGLLYVPLSHAEPLPLLILLHKSGGSPKEWFSGGESFAPYAEKGRFIILAPESPGVSWGTGPKTGVTTTWRSIAL